MQTDLNDFVMNRMSATYRILCFRQVFRKAIIANPMTSFLLK